MFCSAPATARNRTSGRQTARGCTEPHDGPRDGTVAYNGVEMIEEQNVGTGDRIDDGAGMDEDEGLDIRKGDRQELAEEPGVVTGDGSRPDEGPANCAGLHDVPRDGMPA